MKSRSEEGGGGINLVEGGGEGRGKSRVEGQGESWERSMRWCRGYNQKDGQEAQSEGEQK